MSTPDDQFSKIISEFYSGQENVTQKSLLKVTMKDFPQAPKVREVNK